MVVEIVPDKVKVVTKSKKVKPKIFVAENVYGLLTMPNNPINIIINDLI